MSICKSSVGESDREGKTQQNDNKNFNTLPTTSGLILPQLLQKHQSHEWLPNRKQASTLNINSSPTHIRLEK